MKKRIVLSNENNNKEVKNNKKLRYILCTLLLFIMIIPGINVYAAEGTDNGNEITVDLVPSEDNKYINVNIVNTTDVNYENLCVKVNLPSQLYNEETLELNEEKIDSAQSISKQIKINKVQPVKTKVYSESKKGINKKVIVLSSVVVLSIALGIILIIKKKKNIAVAILVVTMVGGLISPLEVKAATIEKNYTKQDSIKIEGINYEYTIEVKYDEVQTEEVVQPTENFFQEVEYNMSDEEKQQVSSLIGELYFMNDGYYNNYPSEPVNLFNVNALQNGIPYDDNTKMVFLQLLIWEQEYVYNNLKSEDKIISDRKVSAGNINALLQQAFGTQINDFNNMGIYSLNDGYVEFYSGNRGDCQPIVEITGSRQVDQEHVVLTGTVAYKSNIYEYNKSNFTVVASINKNSMFGGLTINSFNMQKILENNPTSCEILLASSESRYIEECEVEALDPAELEYARNEIYARHGYIFNDSKFNEYFSDQAWYTPNPEFKGDDSELNEYEIANRDLILKYENK